MASKRVNKDDDLDRKSGTQSPVGKTSSNHIEACRLDSVDQSVRVNGRGKAPYVTGLRNDDALLSLYASSRFVDASDSAAVVVASDCRPRSAAKLEEGILHLTS